MVIGIRTVHDPERQLLYSLARLRNCGVSPQRIPASRPPTFTGLPSLLKFPYKLDFPQLWKMYSRQNPSFATNCGLMLLQVKASLPHGRWLSWLKQQQESGAIEFSERTASKYMRVAANRNHGSDLEAPSIRAS